MLFIKLEQSANNNSAVIEKKPAELKNKSPKYKVLLHNDPVSYTHLTLPTTPYV